MKLAKITNTKKFRKFWGILGLGLSLVIALQLVSSNFLAGRGQELSDLEQRILHLSRDNDNLRLELSDKTSLNYIAQEAQKLGFSNSVQVIYLNTTDGFSAMAR